MDIVNRGGNKEHISIFHSYEGYSLLRMPPVSREHFGVVNPGGHSTIMYLPNDLTGEEMKAVDFHGGDDVSQAIVFETFNKTTDRGGRFMGRTVSQQMTKKLTSFKEIVEAMY
eukprot:GHVN01000781.1.p1 GENE.GHVN01000781.1~~GHVN01000781.1.p1  ORF type:complete len:127 (-),score=21.61 GHVN01000781.1:61-399(-)